MSTRKVYPYFSSISLLKDKKLASLTSFTVELEDKGKYFFCGSEGFYKELERSYSRVSDTIRTFEKHVKDNAIKKLEGVDIPIQTQRKGFLHVRVNCAYDGSNLKINEEASKLLAEVYTAEEDYNDTVFNFLSNEPKLVTYLSKRPKFFCCCEDFETEV